MTAPDLPLDAEASISHYRQRFEDYLLADGKTANTVSVYVSGLNAISKHCGQSVFAIHDLARLQGMTQQYRSGGIHADVGGANSNNVQAGLRAWLAFQQRLQSAGNTTAAMTTLDTMQAQPLNQILFGPPGTGKTFHTINQALAILAPAYLRQHANDRKALKAEFDRLAGEQRIRFVTFHQSFSYEDFVEGLRAESNDDKQVEYRIEPGVFKRICDDARFGKPEADVGIRPNPTIWKMSINSAGNSPTKTWCLNHGEARIGWGETGDLRQSGEENAYHEELGSGDKGTLRYFAEEMAVGDIVLCIRSADLIEAIGVVSGDYRFDTQPHEGVRSDYNHVRPVRWLYRDLQLPIAPLNAGKRFTMKTVYQLDRFSWGELQEHLQAHGAQPVVQGVAAPRHEPHVLIIDEINRGNISRIFGELITLIEPSKRAGADEALSVTLPYSKKPFSVPANVYLIGTMNTADRSLAGLDVALRRRFTFVDMPPQPELLNDVLVEGINIGALLQLMNQRIAALLDRDHCLGHAWFMPLQSDPTLARLTAIFRQNILPLLQEYFFEDWERIAWVLNDQSKDGQGFIVEDDALDAAVLFPGVGQLNLGKRWRLNEAAFTNADAYRQILAQPGGAAA
ncbi:5-methylcytosine-specific restriction enzyme B [Andreprevotia lacus DSM 23236]|jgi:5-methylcytosine-specific restriction protein B|uniref:5-methylcytosine-specific restriction enzyme B n=1 Tax=Andreprevotia lacus DSM 23236 TaxID=1121001 RepID=A0A1W1XTJ6_9NEIS|nr:AAA family ATPase [Andreprevotia lacus]SMC27300.1 5-methylcytosine-specific restriction enzyme B [Andreprevotia lacus DSM 23236]